MQHSRRQYFAELVILRLNLATRHLIEMLNSLALSSIGKSSSLVLVSGIVLIFHQIRYSAKMLNLTMRDFMRLLGFTTANFMPMQNSIMLHFIEMQFSAIPHSIRILV
jgi:hypothetical protein